MIDSKKIELSKADGTTLPAELHIWEKDPHDPDQVKLGLSFGDERLERSAEDFFSALVGIREFLEPAGLLPRLYGASIDVYPSPMSRSMGAGVKAYKLEPCKQAASKDLVSIFDSGPDIKPATIEAQEAFYENWLKSLL